MEETEAHPPSDLPHRHFGGATHLPYFLGSWDDMEGPPWLGALAHCSELGLTRSWVLPGSLDGCSPTPWPTIRFWLPPSVAMVASGMGLLERTQDYPPLIQSLPSKPCPRTSTTTSTTVQ